VDLDGAWDFRMDPGAVGERDGWFRRGATFPDRIQVPGSWDAQGFGDPTDKVYHNYVGKAWYRRHVAIPREFAGKRAILHVGAVHRSAKVWVNGHHVGGHIGYVTPFEIDVTDQVRPGRTALLIIQVDSAQDWEIDTLTGCVDLIDYMFVNWGGIWHHVWLEARDTTCIDNSFVKPDVARSVASVEVELTNQGSRASRTLVVEALHPDGDRAGRTETIVTLEPGTTSASVDVPVSSPKLWSPNHPHLYRIRASLLDGDRLIDQWEDRFGMRTIEIRGSDIYLNGNKTFLHGYGDDCVFPKTLCPPADHAEYRARFSLAKQFGFNYVRHHSHIPLPEYFDMADELGLLIQPELPIAYEPYFDRARGKPAALQLYRDTWEGAIRNLRNHPSVFAWCMGNEMYNGFELAGELYDRAKALDPTRPVYDSDGLPSGPEVRNGQWDRRTLDVFPLQFDVANVPWGRNAGKHDFAGKPAKPIISHEMGNYTTYPDLRDIALYQHTVKPFWLEAARAELDNRGLLGEAPVFAEHSARLQAVCEKVEVENLRLCPESDGHALWLLQDYWTNTSGLVNHYFQAKGPGAGWYRRFINDVVLLAPHSRCTYEAGEIVAMPLVVSDYGEESLAGSRVTWQVTAPGLVVATGSTEVPAGTAKGIVRLGEIRFRVPDIARPTTLRLAVRLRGDAVGTANDWALWVFPRRAGLGLPASVRVGQVGLASATGAFPEVEPVARDEAAGAPHSALVARALDAGLVEYVARGGHLLLLDPGPLMPTESVTFEPAWWLGSPGADSHAGTVIRPGPPLDDFPHEGFCDLQFYSLTHERPAMLLDDLPVHVRPIIRAIDAYTGGRSKAFLLEFRVGQGVLMVSTLDLSASALRQRPEARWMLRSLLRHLGSGQLEPEAALTASFVRDAVGTARVPADTLWAEGYSRTLGHRGERVEHRSVWEDAAPCEVVRCTDGTQFVEWLTGPAPVGPAGNTVTFRWAGGLGWLTEPESAFTLSIDGQPALQFGVTQRSATWDSPDGSIRLTYEVTATFGPDSIGLFSLSVPRAVCPPGSSLRLRITGSPSGSRRWFILHGYGNALERDW